MKTFGLRMTAFVALFAVLYGLLASFWSDGLSRTIIDVGTVQPAAWIARHLGADAAVFADGPTLRAPDGSVKVLFGCEGADVLMLLLAALLVAPLPWRRRLLGCAAGALFVFSLNQARVLALFYAIRREPEWFGPIHSLLGPLAMVAGVVAFFAWWLRQAPSLGELGAALGPGAR